MPDSPVRLLDLRAPLEASASERLTLYLLDPAKADTPDAAPDGYLSDSRASPAEDIPAGRYLFAQTRGEPSPEGIARDGLELQKEGLWRALALEPRLYVRVLREEDGTVVQALRPIKAAAAI